MSSAQDRPALSDSRTHSCYRPGPKVGLFGGSFNPAHAGHMMVAECGLRQLGLDEVWWLVSPGNPLKASTNNYEERKQSVLDLGLPPQMKISEMEQDFGTRYTADMLARARVRWPRRNFVWLMGADNLRQFPKWKNWQGIFDTLPIAVIGRPGQSVKARLSKPARMYANARINEHSAHILPGLCTPCWTYLTPPLNSLSSTAIRRARADAKQSKR